MKVALSIDIQDIFQPARFYSGTEDEVTGIGQLASDIILILTGVAFSICIFIIVISGIKFVTSAGDQKKLASATSTLTYAIIGLVVTILAFVIVRLVQYFIGSSVAI